MTGSAGRRVLAVGSVNADQTLRVARLVRPGETIRATGVSVAPGGKSANQAVAAARLGARSSFVGAIGDDHYGRLVLTALREAGVEVGGVKVITGEVTGQAAICVDDTGENSIVVLAGANDRLDADQLTPELFVGLGVLMLCFEVAEEIVLAAAERAGEHGALVIINPSPIRPIPTRLSALTDVIIVNELEFRHLTGADRSSDGALTSLGIPAVVITRGAAGATVATPGAGGRWVRHEVPGLPVRPVDTTGCGDAFTGALAARLVAGAELVEAVEFAVLVGAYAATGAGAQSSYPTRQQLDDWLATRMISADHTSRGGPAGPGSGW